MAIIYRLQVQHLFREVALAVIEDHAAALEVVVAVAALDVVALLISIPILIRHAIPTLHASRMTHAHLSPLEVEMRRTATIPIAVVVLAA